MAKLSKLGRMKSRINQQIAKIAQNAAKTVQN